MMRRDGPVLVLGVGNVLLRDDGAGVAVVRALERAVATGDLRLAPDTRLVDGGTLGLALLPLVAEAGALVVVDAIAGGGEPGAVSVLRGAALSGAVPRGVRPPRLSAHREGVGELLAAAAMAGQLPEDVSLVGITPGEIGPGLDLSADVAAGLPAALDATLGELRRLGAGPDAPGWRMDADVRATKGAAA